MSQVITLSDVTYRALAEEARRFHQSPDALAERYLQEHLERCLIRARWRKEMQAFFASVQSRIPAYPPAEIEADITAAAAEVEEMRHASRRSN